MAYTRSRGDESPMVSRALFEARDLEAQRASTSWHWMIGCHMLALAIVGTLATLEIFVGRGKGLWQARAADLDAVNQRDERRDDGPEMEKCAWDGDDDCSQNHCCNREDYTCYKKDDAFAGCRKEAPSDWDGEVVGGFRGWSPDKVGKEDRMGNTLWCIMITSSPGEQKLLEAQKKNSVGIYDCDAHSVFQGTEVDHGGSEGKQAANVQVFIDIWDNEIKVSKQWQNFHWTVKVDADLVFFPDRLRQHIDDAHAPQNTGVYFTTTDDKKGFLGSLEVFSQEAMRMYAAEGRGCSDHLHGMGNEASYMKACMDAVGVGSMFVSNLLDEQVTSGGLSGMGAGVCQSGTTVGFYPFKTQWAWQSCHDASTRASGDEIKSWV